MNKVRRRKGPPFVILERDVLTSQVWKDLTHTEMITYIYLKKNYNGSNNGKIPLPYSEFKGIMAPATISRALKGLETKGWIARGMVGGLYRYYCIYTLTWKYDRQR